MNGYRPVAPQMAGNGQRNPPENKAQGSTFAFRKRWGQIDWRSLASVDVDRIAREMDFQALQQNIMNVTFCNIQSEEFHDVDPNFIKLFRLSQLIIEYLLHSQQYLSEQGHALEQRLQQSQLELESLQGSLSARMEELKTVKKENRKRRKVIEAYQEMMSAGATGLHACPVCQREFVSAEYLQSHIHRRHPEHLSLARREGEEKKNVVTQEELEHRLLDQLSERLQASEAQLREEMARKEREAMESQAREFEAWKQREQERMRHEMQEFQAPILSELRSLQQEKAELEEALQQKQAELEAAQTKRQSHLGRLEGAEELDVGGGSRRRAMEVAQMKEQLESQVQEMQSMLRKQEKSWEKKMRKLSTTYQEQLRESLEKVQSLEQSHHSRHTSAQRERLKEHSHLTQELKTLQQKVKEQEQLLVSQQQLLTSLQSRESSPVAASSPPPPASPSHSELMVHKHLVKLTEPAVPPDSEGDQSESGEGSYSEEEEEEEEEEAMEGEGKDEVDMPDFAPFPHRPMIRTKYDHRPEVLGNIKRETQGILNDALVQRGLSKTAAGLTVAQFEEKMGTLEQERQQRIQTHYNFLEHRERLCHEVDTIAATNCVFEPPKDLQLPRKMKKPHSGGTPMGSSLPGRSSGKPPKPMSSKLSSSLPIQTPSTGPSAVNTPQSTPAHTTQMTEVHPVVTKPAVKVAPLDSESDSELTTEEEEEEEEEEEKEHGRKLPSPTPHTLIPPNNPQVVHVGKGSLDKDEKMEEEEEEDSPWDSDEDSIEALATQHLAGRASSTPIKAFSTTADSSHKVHSLKGKLNLEPNPSKRPAGGVALFPQSQKAATLESDSDDSFNLTESSIAAAPTAQSKQVTSSLQVSDSDAHHNKPISRTATSYSALTTVSVEDFQDSDFSDIEVTRIT